MTVASFGERVQKAYWSERETNVQSEQKAVSLGSAIENATKGMDPYSKQIFKNRTLLPLYKSLGTVDIGALRLVSVSDRTPVRRTEDTRTLNIFEMRDAASIMDYQYRIKERDILTDLADFFNIDASLPQNLQSQYNQRYNTLTAVGNTIKASFMASSIAEQQSDVNILEEQIDDQINRIRRKMNLALLSNTEVVAESQTQVPQLGGFITRSTVAPINVGGTMTNAALQAGVNAIGQQLGFDKQLCLIIGPNEIGPIDDLMINRFPGNQAMAHFERTEIAARMIGNAVVWENMYLPRPGRPVPVVLDPQMPSGTAILFVLDLPRLARFKMEGSTGPFVLARPEPTMYELVLVFDLFTLDDPLQLSRQVFTGLS